MSRTEALRTENDTLHMEVQRLETENRRLREEHVEAATLIDTEGEITTLKAENSRLTDLYEQALQELGTVRTGAGETQEEREEIAALRAECGRLEAEVDHVRRNAELEKYRAIEAEREKWETERAMWEAREQRLVRQLETMELLGRREDREAQPRGSETTPTGLSVLAKSAPERTDIAGSSLGEMREGATLPMCAGENTGISVGPENTTALPQSLSATAPAITPHIAFVGQQLPPLVAFTGERDGVGETIDDWLERFNLIATTCNWSPQYKMANLVMRLGGQAFAFYQSCPASKRTNYDLLVEELRKRFTPVRIQSVQTSLFHERKQGKTESVDQYAQELRRLFSRAYPQSSQGSPETEAMGKSVLASQFTAGLRPELKKNVAGSDLNSIDELLIKARFEEAKQRDLAGIGQSKSLAGSEQNEPNNKQARPNSPSSSVSGNWRRDSKTYTKQYDPPKCFNCGGIGHLKRNCTWRSNRSLSEATTREDVSSRKVAIIAAKADVDGRGREKQNAFRSEVETLREQLRQAELEEALAGVVEEVTLHGISSSGDAKNGVELGPSITAEVEVEGVPVQALLDTGSPVTIVSLDFLIRALLKKKSPNQTIPAWKKELMAKIEPPTVSLHNYGGGKVNTIGQSKLHIKREPFSHELVVQVEKDGAVPLLIGTNLQQQLGFQFVQCNPKGENVDLLKQEPVTLAGATVLNSTSQPVTQSQRGGPSQMAQPGTNCTSAQVHLLQTARLPAQHTRKNIKRAHHEHKKRYGRKSRNPESQIPQQATLLATNEAVAEPTVWTNRLQKRQKKKRERKKSVHGQDDHS